MSRQQAAGNEGPLLRRWFAGWCHAQGPHPGLRARPLPQAGEVNTTADEVPTNESDEERAGTASLTLLVAGLQAALSFARDTLTQSAPSVYAAWLECRVRAALAEFPTAPPPVVEFARTSASLWHCARRRLL